MWGALEMKCIHVLYAGVTYRVTQSVTSCTSTCDTRDTLFLSQCRWGHLDVVQYLCADAGCDVKSEDKYGRTPLHMACE